MFKNDDRIGRRVEDAENVGNLPSRQSGRSRDTGAGAVAMMNIDTDPIEALLASTVKKLDGLDRLDRKWFVETLLDELGFPHGVGAHVDDIENVRDVGEGFVTTVALAVQRQPERTGDVYQAAHGVLVGLLGVVKETLRQQEPPPATATRRRRPAPEARSGP